MTEESYRRLIWNYLSEKVSAEDFVDAFFKQRREDGVGPEYEHADQDPRFLRLLDRVFSACDCFDSELNHPVGLTEEQLRHEVGLLYSVWWDDWPQAKDV